MSNAAALKSARKKLKKTLNKSTTKNDDENDDDDHDVNGNVDVDRLFGLRPRIPDAVYFCSIEPPSQSQQLALEMALRQLQREDPSLRVRYDETTMQTVLGGMGELHLEIVRSRLLTEYKIDADLGPLQIAYKETLDTIGAAAAASARQTHTFEKEIGGSKQNVFLDMSVVVADDSIFGGEMELFRLDTSPEATQRLSLVRPRFLQLVRKGAVAALERGGPKVGGPLLNVQCVLHDFRIGRGTADSFVMAAVAQCIQKVMDNFARHDANENN